MNRVSRLFSGFNARGIRTHYRSREDKRELPGVWAVRSTEGDIGMAARLIAAGVFIGISGLCYLGFREVHDPAYRLKYVEDETKKIYKDHFGTSFIPQK